MLDSQHAPDMGKGDKTSKNLRALCGRRFICHTHNVPRANDALVGISLPSVPPMRLMYISTLYSSLRPNYVANVTMPGADATLRVRRLARASPMTERSCQCRYPVQ
jgi:hypothetical protein